ncbi:MAG TPA: hypothetical protein VMD97_13990 [Candidatus Aquilonibacter sp.]|nr:hypothetical protein [Candidatus Aquilonibacter sp.]
MSKSLAEYLAEVRRAIPAHGSPADTHSTAPINEDVDLSKYRPLELQEKAVIAAMLYQSGPKEQEFLTQLDGLMVQRGCTCGCPSLSFAPPPEGTRVNLYRQNIVADMTGEAGDSLVGLILWQAGGKLTGLEAYDLAGRDPTTPYELPKPETIVSFRNGE